MPNALPSKSAAGFKANTRVFASKRSIKKSRRPGPRPNKSQSDGYDELVDMNPSEDDSVQDNNAVPSFDSSDSQIAITVSSRSAVLQACTVTSGFIAGLGVLIRQVSHFASIEGWPVIDCSSEISFSFEMWHLEVITGLVILTSSCRFLLLKTWPDFAESSEAANQQVLTALQPLDYLVVAFLPGFSEELLFRGALFPVFGINWKSALAVALLFGFLHLGSGRKYSFAVWATFVGLAYAYATILSSSIIVPMVSHAVNNLVGGVMWRYTSKSTN